MKLPFLKELNKEQYLAATTFNGPLLILAGAGSGKTKTLVSRTANMIANNINPENILILTFTNKAAREMKERGVKLLNKIGYEGVQPTFTTFHSWGLNFLKSYVNYNYEYHALKLNFTIADENVQKKIIKPLIKEIFKNHMEFKEKHFFGIATILQNNLLPYEDVKETYDAIQELISKMKNEGKSVNVFTDNKLSNNRDIRMFSELFITYKKTLRENNMADFDDLINLPIDILDHDEVARKFIKRKYNYLMVDEFQDTNYSQIRLLNLILNENQNICVVGDDSQSIYGWRGADIENILSFHKEYKEVLKINLTKNYRSTEEIVGIANKLIGNAEQKHEFKEALEAFRQDKGKVTCRSLETEYDESRVVAFYIKQIIEKKVEPKDIAILYRNNFISISIEKELIKNRIPYRIHKGRSLLQKKAVQELMNHIALFLNPTNNVVLEFCIVSTSKIMSQKKMDFIKQKAVEKNVDLNTFLHSEDIKKVKLNKPQTDKLTSFLAQTDSMRLKIKEGLVNEEFLNEFYKNFLLIKEYERIVQETTSETTREAAGKALEDISTINSIIMSYQTLDEFLEAITLDGTEDKEEENKVNLMTVHSSKGLEFDYVFLLRMNQGILPSTRSLASKALIEEERRLAYVAITRAKRFLHISYIQRSRGELWAPSMFLNEAKLLKRKKLGRTTL